MGINFDLTDLQAFRAVVELGNFRKAAEAISISQPALSRRIDKLESALGVPLFERTTRSVTLTTVGRVFARSAEQLLDDLDVALLGIRDISSSRLGHVTIACVPSVAQPPGPATTPMRCCRQPPSCLMMRLPRMD